MNEASYYIGRGRKVALVLQPYPETIETLEESKDLNRGRAYLREMAEEHGVSVYDTVEDAIRFAVAPGAKASTRGTSRDV